MMQFSFCAKSAEKPTLSPWYSLIFLDNPAFFLIRFLHKTTFAQNHICTKQNEQIQGEKQYVVKGNDAKFSFSYMDT